MSEKIWFSNPTLTDLTSRAENTMSHFLDIEFTELGNDFLAAKMPIGPKTRQPYGYLHGGASAVLAETMGSVASALIINPLEKRIVGLELNCNHIRGVKDGFVEAICKPIHIGKSTHVWDIHIFTPDKKTVCVSRLTVMVLDL